MGYSFTQWDAPEGTMLAGSIKRASSSDNKVWGEENLTNIDLLCGSFVAVNPEGGIKKIGSADDLIHGIIVRDIYGDKAPHNRQVNVGHFSHGDCVVALAIEGVELARGSRVYVVATGDDAGKVTNVAAGNIDLGYWVEDVSKGNNCAAITLGYSTRTAEKGE